MIWLLRLAAGLVLGGLIVGGIYELDALEHHPDETISDIVRRWILRHVALAYLLTIASVLFLIWLGLHFWQVIP